MGNIDLLLGGEELKPIIRIAKIKGKEVYYDICGKKINDYPKKYFDFIGKGQIFSINGVKQTGSKEKDIYFFRLKEKYY